VFILIDIGNYEYPYNVEVLLNYMTDVLVSTLLR